MTRWRASWSGEAHWNEVTLLTFSRWHSSSNMIITFYLSPSTGQTYKWDLRFLFSFLLEKLMWSCHDGMFCSFGNVSLRHCLNRSFLTCSILYALTIQLRVSVVHYAEEYAIAWGKSSKNSAETREQMSILSWNFSSRMKSQVQRWPRKVPRYFGSIEIIS